MRAWYAIQTKYNKEEDVIFALASRGYRGYCPLTLIDKRLQKNEKRTTAPLFPLYAFVQMDEGTDDFYPITKTPGVWKIVKMTAREDGFLYPTKMPDLIIESLMAMEDDNGIHSRHKSDYEKGDSVTVIRGPFKAFPAEIHSMDKEQRVFILLDFLNGTKRVEVNYRDIVPVVNG